ncbi:MAG: hydrogenase maturation protease [Isosphaera sp.]|nr:hydrogenase maturation protease [Isosphaera sp.]
MSRRVLVAGIGNVFRGDDAFGCEVVRLLVGRALPPGVRVRDFGTRGHDLAYALLDGYDAVILVDAVRRDGEPGSLHTLELDPADPGGEDPPGTHGVDLPGACRLVRAMGGTPPPLYLVGCVPADFGGEDEGAMGLTDPVAAAVEPAAARVVALLAELLAEPARA